VLAASAKILRERPSVICGGAAARLRGIWDVERRSVAEAAFLATHVPYARDTFAKVAASLDRYAGTWVAMHEEACRATRVEGRQSDSLLDLRMACLERRRATLGALTHEWAAGVEAQALENAIAAAASLPPLDECADARALTERVPLPKNAATVMAIEAVRAHLDQVRALGDAKRLKEARTHAELARREADATGFAPVQADAAFGLGSLLHSFGEPGAIEPLTDAVRLAESARDDRLAAAAVIELTGAMADDRGLASSAVLLSPVAEALVVRAGNRPEQQGALLRARGSALQIVGKFTESLAALSQARSLLTASVGPRDPVTLKVLFDLVRTSEALADYTTRDALAKELLASETAVFGPDHPETGRLLDRLGLIACGSGDYPTARSLLQRSLAIADSAFGKKSLPSATTLNDLGVLEDSEGHLAEAARDYELVLTIRRALLSPDHPLVANALAKLSIVRRVQGRYEEALTELQTALAIMRRTYGDVHSEVAFELVMLGELLAAKGDLNGARESFERGLDTFNRSNGPQHLATLWGTVTVARFYARTGMCVEARKLLGPATTSLEQHGIPMAPVLAHALLATAQCDLRDGAAAVAVKRLERALEIEEKPGRALGERGLIRFELARALHASGSGDARARGIALQAEDELTRAGAFGAQELKRVKAWLRRLDTIGRDH
jgi:tetratricopeptide (TPR) repeat protein